MDTVLDTKRDELVILEGLEGNPPAHELNRGQALIAPYASEIITMWWLLWCGILLYVTVKFILLPRIKAWRTKE